MLYFIHPDRWLFAQRLQRSNGAERWLSGAEASPLLLANPAVLPGRERLRHLIIGSPEAVRSAIHTLHVLRYAEQATWSQLITIPESGMVITPAQGEMFSLLRRDLT